MTAKGRAPILFGHDPSSMIGLGSIAALRARVHGLHCECARWDRWG